MTNIEYANKMYSMGKMPLRYWVQQNGRTAQENFNYQREKIIKDAMRKKELEQLKKQIEEELFIANMTAIDESAGALEQDVATNVVNNISATFNGGIYPERLNSFSKQIAIGLGRAIGNMPFKLIEDFFDKYDD